MLLFWILWSIAILLCIANFVFIVHMLVSSNKMLNSVKDWAVEIDKSNFQYIKQEFARLMYENGLTFKDKNNLNNSEDDECEIVVGENV